MSTNLLSILNTTLLAPERGSELTEPTYVGHSTDILRSFEDAIALNAATIQFGPWHTSLQLGLLQQPFIQPDMFEVALIQ